MTMQPKYQELLIDEDVRRWFENLKAKSILAATVALRNLGHYCELTQTDPKDILKKASESEKDFRYEFTDFVRKMEKNGKACRYHSGLRSDIHFFIRHLNVRPK